MKHCNYTAALFLILLLWAAPVFANGKNSSLPVQSAEFTRMVSGQYVIDVHINGGGPYKMMVDTGASRTSVFEDTARVIGITEIPGETRNVIGMTGAESRPVARIDGLEFADISFSGREIIILENWPFPEEKLDGILGMDVLGGLILRFSHKGRFIQISTDGKLSKRSVARWAKITLTDNPYPSDGFGLKFTNSKFGDLHIPTMLDTGASFTAISWDIVQNTRLAGEQRRLRQDWTVQGAVGSFKPRLRVRFDKFVIDGFILKPRDLIIMDFDNLPINNFGDYPLVIAGVDLMDGHDFVLDFANDRLYINQRLKKYRLRGSMRALSEIDALTRVIQ